MNNDYIRQELQTWELISEPIRPSRQELDFMRVVVERSFEDPRVLVLGATPEPVDTIVDIEPQRIVVGETRSGAIEAMRQLAKQDWESAEFLTDDWRNRHPELEGQSEVIVGHGALLFLSYTCEWQSVMGILRRYLVDDGVIVLRSLFLPPRGHELQSNYERQLAEFEQAGASQKEIERSRRFVDMTTGIRITAILALTLDNGVVDHERLREAMQWVREDLTRRYRGQIIWDVMAPEFKNTRQRGYEDVWPLAAPKWKQAKPVLEECGFHLEIQFIGDKPVPGCFCVITARKRS
jgi:hypothetical protein